MTIPAEQIPLWFWIMAISILVAGIITLFKYIVNRNKDDWTEVRGGLKTLTENINDLIKIQTLHTHQINENAADIKELRNKMIGGPVVKY